MGIIHYYPRICDKVLLSKLQITGAVLVVGPRWCGKTKTALQAAANLIQLKNKVDTARIGDPSFLMILTGGKFAYKRNDGVLVVPLACLRD